MRLAWQCRRGQRELECLLTAYLTQHYPNALPAEQRAFERLLTESDATLQAWLLQQQPADDAELNALVTHLRQTIQPET